MVDNNEEMVENNEVRELIFGYKTKATFKGAENRPCRHRTSRCPNECGHGGMVYTFHIDSIEVQNNPDSKQA